MHSAAQHAELMHKVENLNVFTESNAMLRQEKERLEQQVKELTLKVGTGFYSCINFSIGTD